MANPEHVEILKRGAKVWNKWRERNPDIEPDLSGAHIDSFAQKLTQDLPDPEETYLCGANFCEANLVGAQLISVRTYARAILTDGDFSC